MDNRKNAAEKYDLSMFLPFWEDLSAIHKRALGSCQVSNYSSGEKFLSVPPRETAFCLFCAAVSAYIFPLRAAGSSPCTVFRPAVCVRCCRWTGPEYPPWKPTAAVRSSISPLRFCSQFSHIFRTRLTFSSAAPPTISSPCSATSNIPFSALCAAAWQDLYWKTVRRTQTLSVSPTSSLQTTSAPPGKS
jgi:hypothetical protein